MIFPHSITLFSTTLEQSPNGGLKPNVGTNGTSYSAFVQVKSDMVDIINQTAGARTGATIYVRGDCPAKQLDRITFGTKTYEVMGAMPQRSPREIHHTKIMALELDQTTR
jgi:hypothetical protein